MSSNDENTLLAEIREVKLNQKRLEILLLTGNPETNEPGLFERVRRLEWFKKIFIACLAGIFTILGGMVGDLLMQKLAGG